LLAPGRPAVDPRPASGATSADLGALVDQFTAEDSAGVVRRLEADPRIADGDPAALTLLGLGYQQRFRETGDPSWLGSAAAALGRASEKGRDAVTLSALAQLAVTQHRFGNGAALAREALRADPASSLARGALGDALLNLGRYDAAFAQYDRLAAAGPSVGAYARVATARQLLGDRAGAIDAMELALEAGSGIPEQEAWALVRYAELLRASGRLDAAARADRRALRLVPGYVHARAGLARIAATHGDLRGAARGLSGVVDELPTVENAVLLADALERSGRARRAHEAVALVGTLERLLGANGVRTELQSALFDLDRGRTPAAALGRARAAYRAAPSVYAADAVAWGLARTGRCAVARGWSDRALRLGTREALFLFHRGWIARCTGNAAAAQTFFRAALARDPGFSLRWAPVARRLAADGAAS
jgi:tetratricopeptide (TPR) repeat protein